MRGRYTILVLSVVIFMIFFVSTSKSGANKEGKVPILKFGYIHNDHQTPLYVAIKKWEYFKEKHGTYLKPVSEKTKCELWSGGQKLAYVDLVRTRGGSAFTTIMGQGHIEMGCGGVPAMLFAIDKGMEAKILCPLMTEGDALVVKPDSRIKSWENFVSFVKQNKEKPLKIGYKVPVAVAKTVFEGAMNAEDITYTENAARRDVDVLLVNMKGNKNIIPGLERGVIDACVTNMPVPAIAQGKGAGKIVTYLATLPPKGEWIDHPCCSVVATDELIKNQPDIVAGLVEVIIRAARWMEKNPDEVPGICSDWLGTSIKDERVSLKCIKFTVDPTDAWKTGTFKYINLMQNLGEISGKLKGKTQDKISSLIFDFGPYKKAVTEMDSQK